MGERLSKIEKLIDHTTIRAFVEQKKLGWEISGPFYTSAPTPKTEYIEKCTKEIEALEHHLLKTVIIKDDFKVDTDRTDFVAKDDALSKFCSTYSKLKGNKLLTLIYKMEDMIEEIRRKNPKLSKRLATHLKIEEINEELKVYRQMTFEAKVAFARKLDDIIYKFLEVLSK
ncbi:MAG: hypothetical protein V4699_00050 [Patescibacteria group bacterium]